MSCRSERSPSKNRMSCSLKKTTGSMTGSPGLGIGVTDQVAHKAQVERPLQMAIEVNLAGPDPPASRVEARQRPGPSAPSWPATPPASRVSQRSRILSPEPLFQHPGSFLRQGATGAIVVIEADVDGHHFRVKRIADTDDSKVCEVHLT